MKKLFFLCCLGLFSLLGTTNIQAQDQTIVEIAAGNENFTTLVAAVTAADLVETLNGEGNFTVFAPTDDAFAALPDGLVAALVKPENKAALQKILTYHVVGAKLPAADVIAGINSNNNALAATTVEGGQFTAMLKDGNVKIKDAQGNVATVVTTDIMASNGVIHVIDRVILPAGVDPAALLPKAMGMKKEARTGKSIAELAIETEQLSTLVAALQAAELVDLFKADGQFTVFAPTNDAFAALPAGTVESLVKPENQAQLQAILQYHAVFAPISAKDLVAALEAGNGYYNFDTAGGQSLVASLQDGKVMLTDGNGNSVTVIKTDIIANNGVVHLIDGVLLPKATEAAPTRRR